MKITMKTVLSGMKVTAGVITGAVGVSYAVNGILSIKKDIEEAKEQDIDISELDIEEVNTEETI